MLTPCPDRCPWPPPRRRRLSLPSPYTLVLAGVLLLLTLPLVATLGYALASRWGATLLPEGLTLAWFLELWTTPRFLAAFGRSLLVAGAPWRSPWR